MSIGGLAIRKKRHRTLVQGVCLLIMLLLPFALYPAAMAGHRLWLHALLLLLTLATVVALWVS